MILFVFKLWMSQASLTGLQFFNLRRADSQNAPLLSLAEKLELSNLGIMQTVIRIQATLAMNFNHIL